MMPGARPSPSPISTPGALPRIPLLGVAVDAVPLAGAVERITAWVVEGSDREGRRPHVTW